MSSKEFRNAVSAAIRRNRGFGAKTRASRSLVDGLMEYSRLLSNYGDSPILREIQDHISKLTSTNPVVIHSAATQARTLCLTYCANGSFVPLFFEVIMLEVAMNGLFTVSPGMRSAAQQSLDEMLEPMWSLLDTGYEFGMYIYSATDSARAEELMQELFACAQILTGLSFC